MTWIDVVIVLLFLAAICAEAARGFAKGAVAFFCLYVALHLSNALYANLANSVKFLAAPTANQSLIFFLLFLVFGALAIVISELVQSYMQVDIGYFENLLGAFFGLLSGGVLSHVFVRVLTIAHPEGDPFYQIVLNSSLGNEMLVFTTFHSIMDGLYAFRQVR